MAQLREALRDGERARVQQAAQHRLAAPGLLARLRGLHEPHVGLGEMEHAVRLEPREQRVAVPRVEHVGHRGRPGRVGAPHDAEAEERRHDRQAQAVARGDEVLDGGEHAVAWTALARRGSAVRQAAGPDSRLVRMQAAALVDRLAPLRRDAVGRVVVVAAPVRPADVVEHEQRQVGAGALGDEAQLLADREVVVVPVDDHRIRRRQVRQRGQAGLTHQLQLRARLGQAHQPLLRRRVDRDHARARPRGPVDQDLREVARVRADLDDRARAGRVEAREQDLGQVLHRVPPAAGIAGVGVDLRLGSLHERASVSAALPPSATLDRALTAGTDLPPQLDAPLPASGPAPSPALAPPPGNPRFPLFDSLRGLAVLGVVVYHVFVFTGALNREGIGDIAAVAGSQGPILFFAISGFLLYRPWVASRAGGKPAPGALRYGRRRALRILPAYWFALTVLAVWPGISGVFTDEWWRYYFFLQLYDTDTLGLGIPVAWTLCVEVSFYLALPLWVLAARRLSLRAELVALGALALAGAAVQVAAGREQIADVAAQSLLGQSTWFALGMGLAIASVAGRDRLRALADHPWLCVGGAALAFAALIPLRHEPGGLLGIVAALQTQQPYPKLLADIALTGVMLTLLLVPAVWDTPARAPQRLLAAAPLAWLGLISYGVYLWHLTLAELLILPSMPVHFEADGLGLGPKLGDGVTPLALALTLIAACAVAAASYRFVELPFLRRKEG